MTRPVVKPKSDAAGRAWTSLQGCVNYDCGFHDAYDTAVTRFAGAPGEGGRGHFNRIMARIRAGLQARGRLANGEIPVLIDGNGIDYR